MKATGGTRRLQGPATKAAFASGGIFP